MCKNDILIELVQNRDFIEMKKNTRFGKLISGTDYGDYAIENEFLRDNKTFNEKKSGNCEFFFKFVYKENIYGVWINMNEGKLFVSNDYDENKAKDYSDAEDFYDDHYDDFDDFEDAEDYFDDYGE